MLYLISLFHILTKYTFKTPSFEKLKLSVMTIWSCVKECKQMKFLNAALRSFVGSSWDNERSTYRYNVVVRLSKGLIYQHVV